MSSKRSLLMTVAQSIMLHGAEVWADSVELEVYKRRMISVQWQGALRIMCAYRIMSKAAELVVEGGMPIKLLAVVTKLQPHTITDWTWVLPWYLYRMDKSPLCIYCVRAVDDVQHAFIWYDRWTHQIREFIRKRGNEEPVIEDTTPNRTGRK